MRFNQIANYRISGILDRVANSQIHYKKMQFLKSTLHQYFYILSYVITKMTGNLSNLARSFAISEEETI